jgi:hypothetical protein
MEPISAAPMPEREPKIVWVCILGDDCMCDRSDHSSQFCVNTRRREVDPNDDDDED